MRILILCTGNSCRSQMAQGWLQSFDKSLDVHSAGTEPAAKVSSKAIRVMAEAGVDISGHYPKTVSQYLDQEWDHVITVCGEANETCPVFIGKVNKRTHIGFEDPSRTIGTEEIVLAEFRRIRDEIKNRLYQYYRENIQDN